MSEKFTPRTELGAEAREARESYRKARENLGKIAMESLTHKKANRMRKVGARLVAGSELRNYRKELSKDRKDRFTEAAYGYKLDAKDAKDKIRFAKHGYRIREKRQLVKEKTAEFKKAMDQRDKETGKFNVGRGLVGRLGNRIQERGNNKNAKMQARGVVEGHEASERAKLEDYRDERRNARNSRARAMQSRREYSSRNILTNPRNALATPFHLGRDSRPSIPNVRTTIRDRAERIPVLNDGNAINDERVKAQLERTAAKHVEMSRILRGEEPVVTPLEAVPPAPDFPMIELVDGTEPAAPVIELHPPTPETEDTAKAA